jgi:hypothetical protein
MTAKKYRICRICGFDERTGGGWVDKRNPQYTDKKVIYANIERLEGHGLCLIMEGKRGKGWVWPQRSDKYGRDNSKKSIK